MSDSEKKKLDDVVEVLTNNYEDALKMEHVVNPLAYALYYTWKHYDEKVKK